MVRMQYHQRRPSLSTNNERHEIFHGHKWSQTLVLGRSYSDSAQILPQPPSLKLHCTSPLYSNELLMLPEKAYFWVERQDRNSRYTLYSNLLWIILKE